MKEAIESNINPTSISNLIKQKFNMNVSSAQVRELRNQYIDEVYHLCADSPVGMSVDKVIKLFKTFDVVSFVHAMHQFSCGFVRYANKTGS